MYEPLRRRVLAFLKVPPEPHAPLGDPASLRVFRAGRNYFRLRLASWVFAQTLALAGIIFWAAVFITVESELRDGHHPQQARINPKEVRNFEEYLEKIGAAQPPGPNKPAAESKSGKNAKGRPRVQINGWAGFKLMLVQLAIWLPPWAFPLIWALKITGFVIYLVQIPLTYAVRRLDYEMHWYMVTDRSLRLRHGVWKIVESTMSFANLQQVVVTQGPLQRWLGLADVRVQSAGGGGGDQHGKGGTDETLHTAVFHAVDNAHEIRDLILSRLRQFRAAGLGDPDDAMHAAATSSEPAPITATTGSDALTAARELLDEARALRGALAR